MSGPMTSEASNSGTATAPNALKIQENATWVTSPSRSAAKSPATRNGAKAKKSMNRSSIKKSR